MKPLEFPLLADENIQLEVFRRLASEGNDILSVFEEGLLGKEDAEILRYAHARSRVVLTHDADFGTLAIRRGEPFTGILYLRPGHISASFVMETIHAVASLSTDVEPPFIVVAERKADSVKIRIRAGSPGT